MADVYEQISYSTFNPPKNHQKQWDSDLWDLIKQYMQNAITIRFNESIRRLT